MSLSSLVDCAFKAMSRTASERSATATFVGLREGGHVSTSVRVIVRSPDFDTPIDENAVDSSRRSLVFMSPAKDWGGAVPQQGDTVQWNGVTYSVTDVQWRMEFLRISAREGEPLARWGEP